MGVVRCEADVWPGDRVCQAQLRRDGTCPREQGHLPSEAEVQRTLHEAGITSAPDDEQDRKARR
jgi:hypothetical protein